MKYSSNYIFFLKLLIPFFEKLINFLLSNNKYLIKDEALKILLKTFPDFVQFDISLAFPAFKETKGKPEADDSNNTSGEHSNLEVNKNKSLLKNADNTFFLFIFWKK